MSVQERRLQKPACEMTPEEWEGQKRSVDQHRAAMGKAPVDWSKMAQPRPMSEEGRQWALELFGRLGKLPR
jgi:hypothetical protein